jgi:hypothetical protein
MNILGDVQTSFALVLCAGTFKAHYCPQSLVGGLVSDIESRGGSVSEVKEINEGGMDLPGMIMSDRPWEDLMIGDFKFSVPSQDFEYILDELQRVETRKFSDGQEYFKIHGSYQCLVLTPEQRDTLLETMYDMLPDVRKRSEEADEEFSRRLALARDRGAKVISARDKKDPRVVRVTDPPKDNN